MRIALIGGKGMLGSDIADALRARGDDPWIGDLPEIDILDADALAAALPPCEAVINCAAFTRVDDAEKERPAAFAINATGAGNVARACAARGLRLIHISTDYVFDGRKGSPCTEDDPVAPLNYYGETKLAGEREVQAAGGTWTIVRTQSLYGLRGRNFIKAILNQIHQGKTELRVVNDQVSSPTYTRHLADALLRLCATPCSGLVNVASRGGCSWFAFAEAIVRHTGARVQVLPRSTAELNYPALRPAYSVLDTARYTRLTNHLLPTWQEGLAAYLNEEPLARLT